MFKPDQEVFTRICGDNPDYVLSALRTWASAWAKGEPTYDEMEDYAPYAHPYEVGQVLAKGTPLSWGSQHVPALEARRQ